jgi:two-component system, probable response regulator PhcQ
MLGSALHASGHEQALYRYAEAARAAGGAEPMVDWSRWDHADLLQAEARRGAVIAAHLRDALQAFGPRGEAGDALLALARSVGGEVSGDGVLVASANVFTALLVSPAGETPTAPECAWLAWLLWQAGHARVTPAQGGWLVRPCAPDALRADWLADAMERLGKEPA